MGTLAENVAQVKADFKSIRDGFGEYFDSIYDEPTSAYGNYPFYTYNRGKDEGIEQGIEQGKQEVISNSRYIEKQASGKVIRLDDVSEVAHKVKVKADTPTEVKVYGKNLFNIDDDTRFTKQSDGSYISNTSITAKNIPLSLPYGTYTYSYDISCKTGINGRLSIGFKDGTRVEVYAASDGTFKHTEKTVTGEIVNWSFLTSVLPVAGEMTIKNIQLEVGSASPYEPYKEQTITATPSGTEVASMCPIMNLLADSDVTVDYFGSYGMQTEYDRFWDSFQQNGSKTNYNYAFYGTNWNDAIFKPKYDIIATNLTQGFYDAEITNLVDRLEEQGIRFDTSGCKSLGYAFGHSALTVLPKLDMSSCTNSDSMCVGCYYLTRCEGIVSSDITKFYTGTFQNCSALEHCIFEGTIASNINLKWSKKLSRESILSLLQCLKATVSGIVITLPSMCIDGATDTLAMIQADTELNTAYNNALAKGYTISFV